MAVWGDYANVLVCFGYLSFVNIVYLCNYYTNILQSHCLQSIYAENVALRRNDTFSENHWQGTDLFSRIYLIQSLLIPLTLEQRINTTKHVTFQIKITAARRKIIMR